MFKEPVVFVDIETTGGSYKTSRIIEVAALRVENNEVVDEFQTLVNPGTYLPQFITNLTGITDSDLADAPYFDDIAHSLMRIFDNAVFVAHNVRFDYSFVKHQLEAAGHTYRPKLLCTVRLSRALYPQARGHSLEKVIRRHGITVTSRHRAYDDAFALWEFSKLAHAEHGQEAFDIAVAKQYKAKTLPPNLSEEYVKDIKNVPGVYIFEDESGQPIYIGKSVHLRNRILSHFTDATKLNKEMKLSQNTHKVSVIETANELEALLLESQMIKDVLPVYNRMLRRTQTQAVIQSELNEDGYAVLKLATVKTADLGTMQHIYGVYPNRTKAKLSLEDHLRTYQLCPKLLGLEKSNGACFLYQLDRCRGACIGREPLEGYNARVELAMERSKVEAWPYKSAVLLKFRGDEKYALVIDQWNVIGSLKTDETGQPHFEKMGQGFNIDTYRILHSFIKRNAATIKMTAISPEQLASLGDI